jgi:hypothetical protein
MERVAGGYTNLRFVAAVSILACGPRLDSPLAQQQNVYFKPKMFNLFAVIGPGLLG